MHLMSGARWMRVEIGSIRKISQTISFLIFNLGLNFSLKTGIICPGLYCYGCPFSTFACPIGIIQNYITLGRVPIYPAGGLGVYGISLGRFLCGWICPFGTIQELLGKMKKKSLNPKPAWFTKYIMLIIVLVSSWVTLDTLFCKFCPSGSLFAAIPSKILYPELPFGFFFYVHMSTLVISIVLFIFVSRFWCRYLCPLGAIMGSFNRISILKIERDPNKCTECGVCLKDCPMNIQEVRDIGVSSDCIMCGQCIDDCPLDALKIKIHS